MTGLLDALDRAVGWGQQHIEVLVLAGLGVTAPRFAPPSAPGLLHPGAGAEIRIAGAGDTNERVIGQLGEVHPRVARALGLEARALYLEIALDGVQGARREVRSTPPPRFPAVTRDVSFWIDAGVSADEQRARMTAAAGPLLEDLAVLEDYRDPRTTPAGKKGMLWTLTYRSRERTLTDADVDAAHANVISALATIPSLAIR